LEKASDAVVDLKNAAKQDKKTTDQKVKKLEQKSTE
jgi:hypothetical protein